MADEVKINVDLSQVKDLGADVRAVGEVGLRRTVERGEQILREEVPKVTHNLEQGVSSHVDSSSLTAQLLIAARTGRMGVEGALLHLPSGATREITLRARAPFDYAEAVARGTGIYGPRGAVIRPKNGKALLIPVDSKPVSENGKPQAYITMGGKIYVMRRFSKGRKANQYDVRAAQRLEAEVPAIWDRVVQAFANGEEEF